MLQFHLLKYLKYDDFVKFSLVCKETGRLCDFNKILNNNEKPLRYLMVAIAL